MKPIDVDLNTYAVSKAMESQHKLVFTGDDSQSPRRRLNPTDKGEDGAFRRLPAAQAYLEVAVDLGNCGYRYARRGRGNHAARVVPRDGDVRMAGIQKKDDTVWDGAARRMRHQLIHGLAASVVGSGHSELVTTRSR